jgi:hypothetical protein
VFRVTVSYLSGKLAAMRVTTSAPGETVAFDGLRAVVGAGEDVVGRFPGIVCVARCPEPGPLREFLALCASVGGPDPGRALARRLATWMSGPTAPGPGLRFGTMAAAGDHLAVFLVGAVEARVDGLGGLTLSGAHAAIGTDRLFPLPRTPVVLSLDGGQVRADPANVHDLRAGVVPGAAVVLHPPAFDFDERDAAEGAGLAGHEWFEAADLDADPLDDQSLWSQGLPAQRTGGRNGSNHTPTQAVEDNDPTGGPDEVGLESAPDVVAHPLNGDAGRHSFFGEADPTVPPVADPGAGSLIEGGLPTADPPGVDPADDSVDDDSADHDSADYNGADRLDDAIAPSAAARRDAEARSTADPTADHLDNSEHDREEPAADRGAPTLDGRTREPRTGDPPLDTDGRGGSDLWAVGPRAADRPEDVSGKDSGWSAFSADPLDGRFPGGPDVPADDDGVGPHDADLWAGERRGADLWGADVAPDGHLWSSADPGDDLFAASGQDAERPADRVDTPAVGRAVEPKAAADSLFAAGPPADRLPDAEAADRPLQRRPKPGPRRGEARPPAAQTPVTQSPATQPPATRPPDAGRGPGPSPAEATSTMPGLLVRVDGQPTAVPDLRPTPMPVPAAAPDPGRGGGARIRGYRCENGHLNDPRLPTCRQCGATIDERAGGLVVGPRPTLGLLVFDDGTAHVVDGGYLVGRMPEVDDRVRSGELRPIVLEDRAGSVSRVHAEIRVSGWDVVVVDTGSRNGTYVCGPDENAWTELPPRRSRRLQPGARVRLGARVFVFESSSTVR